MRVSDLRRGGRSRPGWCGGDGRRGVGACRKAVAAQEAVNGLLTAPLTTVHMRFDAPPFRLGHRIVGIEGSAKKFRRRAECIRRHESISSAAWFAVRLDHNQPNGAFPKNAR